MFPAGRPPIANGGGHYGSPLATTLSLMFQLFDCSHTLSQWFPTFSVSRPLLTIWLKDVDPLIKAVNAVTYKWSLLEKAIIRFAFKIRNVSRHFSRDNFTLNLLAKIFFSQLRSWANEISPLLPSL